MDFHTSYNVFEHIPSGMLADILTEGNRIARTSGLFAHRIDYSDHFSHSDPGISSINFLQYSDKEWRSYAGNRYMYMNRLRHDDYMRLFEEAGQHVLATEPVGDERARDLLDKGMLKVDPKFEAKSKEVLSIISSWFVTRKSA